MPFIHSTACPIEPSQIGVAISRGDFGTHIGLIFTDNEKQTRILHLAWHKKILVDNYPIDEKRCWVSIIPDLHPITAKTLVGILRKVARRQPKIPYGIGVLAAFGSFSPEGDYKAPKGSDGLTCATFVSELLKAHGVRLIQESTWPEGVNAEWAGDVHAALKQWDGVDENHLAAVQSNTLGIRIRPEELGAVADTPSKTWPLPYTEAATRSADVLLGLNIYCPLPAITAIH